MPFGSPKRQESLHQTSVQCEQKQCHRRSALPTPEPSAKPKLTLREGHRNPQPGERCVGCCKEEDQEISQSAPLGIIGLGSFGVLSDHGDTMLLANPQKNPQTLCHLFPGFKDTRTSRHAEVRCGKFLKTLQWQQPPRRRSVFLCLGGDPIPSPEERLILSQSSSLLSSVFFCFCVLEPIRRIVRVSDHT